jgi:hypothetical protein
LSFISRNLTRFSHVWYSVGLPNVLALLKSEDLDVQIHAVRVVANLDAEGPGVRPLELCIF